METRIVNRFAVLMAERKKKISEVARATGISRTTLTGLYYESCHAISFGTLSKLCDYFDCEVDDILVRESA